MVVILGGVSDIGFAIAHRYAQHGWSIILAAREGSEVERNVRDLQVRYGVAASSVVFDACRSDQGPAHLLGEFANRMSERGSGTIVGVSSVAGDRGRASNYVYGAAKAGLSAFLSGLRNRLLRHGVHVVTVKPGFVRTRMTKDLRLPRLLTAEAEEVGRVVYDAAEIRRRNVVYVRPIWRSIMFVINHLPEGLFKRLRL
jgi:short-subunit dehydrogenase